ncbi:hypothetical protein [Streptomyces luteireticuli]|uniref:hypothetical protein n=1 Tax=Streptomyces luteireticuli TaxID=173858 RepID=UPI003558C43E
MRYFVVPVAVAGSGAVRQVTVVRAPAEVAAPSAALARSTTDSLSVPPDSPLARTAGEFLSAYLGGGPGVSDRFLAPGVKLPPVSPAPYRTVQLERVAVSRGSGESSDGAVGRDGEVARVAAQVVARDGAGRQWPLAYDLRLTARGGRWEIAGLGSEPEGAR